MFKYILGGVALIATGYGLAKLADEYGWFDEQKLSFSENIDEIELDNKNENLTNKNDTLKG